MYCKGHYGVSLLVFAPVGGALVAAGRPGLALVTGGAMVSLATLPDVDTRIPGMTHRGATHTLAFTALVGVVLGFVCAFVAARTPFGHVVGGAYGFGLGVLAVGAHLLGDLLTPAGVAPFWPLSGRRYSLSVTTAADPLWNYALLAAGVLAAFAAVAAAVRL